MGTQTVSTPPREAGAHAQEHANLLRRRLAFAALASLAITAIAFLVLGGRGPVLIGVEIVALAAMALAMRLFEPRADRWERGAKGERVVGAILEDIGPDWHVLHDIYLGRGNIDHLLVGPGGTFTIETKSNRGRFSVGQIDEKMLRQAYAESKVIERITGLEVEPLLVFSQAWLVGSMPARRRGVTVVPARRLASFLERRRPVLGADEAAEIAERLRLALEVDNPR